MTTNFAPQDLYTLNNGILLASFDYGKNMHFHMDEAHISNINNLSNIQKPMTDLGLIDKTRNQAGLNYRPQENLWNLNAMGGMNVKMVDNADGLFTWSEALPDTMHNRARILSAEASNPEKPGADGSPIWIRLDKRLIGANGSITFSKFSQVELYCNNAPSGSPAEGFLYEFYLTVNNNSINHLDAAYLKVNSIVTAGAALTSEFNTAYDDRGISANTQMFYNTMGNAVNQKWFSVTRAGGMTKTSSGDNVMSIALSLHQNSFKLDLLRDGSYAQKGSNLSGVDAISKYLKAGGYDSKSLAKDTVHSLIVPQIEAYYMSLMKYEVENYSIWGNGGTRMIAGKKVQLPVGLFRQIYKNANKASYNISNFNFDHFLAFIRRGYSKIASPANRVVLDVKVGMGAYTFAQEALVKKLGKIPMLINGNEFMTNKGNGNMNMGFQMAFSQFTYPLGDIELRFVYAKELDCVSDDSDKDQLDNPMTNLGYRLSSYCFIIDDITATGENIIELRNSTLANDPNDFHIFWVDGKMPYMGDKSRHQSSGPQIAGYEVYLELPYKAYHVVDCKRTFMYLPINPKTGSAFGSSLNNWS